MKYLLLLLLTCVALIANDIVFYNPVSSPITNRVTSFRESLNEILYVGATNALIITNRAAQSGPGVTLSNLTYWCVVDGRWVRVMSQAEVDRIAATNALNELAAQASLKYEARVFASNIIVATNVTEGQQLFLRALGQTTWFLVNQIRTNDGKPAITPGAFATMIYTNIDNFSQ